MVNIIVLWNTLYMTAAVERLKQSGYPVQEEDVARLSPLIHEHINMLGRYSLAVPEEVARGELRPLRNPEETCRGEPGRFVEGPWLIRKGQSWPGLSSANARVLTFMSAV